MMCLRYCCAGVRRDLIGVPVRTLKAQARSVKVVLLQDLQNKGRAGEIVSLRPGFVRNFLYPAGKVKYATHENIAQFATDTKKIDIEIEENMELSPGNMKTFIHEHDELHTGENLDIIHVEEKPLGAEIIGSTGFDEMEFDHIGDHDPLKEFDKSEEDKTRSKSPGEHQ